MPGGCCLHAFSVLWRREQIWYNDGVIILYPLGKCDNQKRRIKRDHKEKIMRILFIRHGDPDYEHDSLTEKGVREAQLLADRMVKEDIRDFYVSPLGRARKTGSYTLERLGRAAQVKDWLQEFPAEVDIGGSEFLQKAFPDTEKEGSGYRKRISWDMLPGCWGDKPEYFDRYAWRNTEVAAHSRMNQAYDAMAAGLDELLAQYGYFRDGSWYHTEQGNNDTIVCFCHFGVICAMLSYLWNVSPFILWHSLALAPTSVTEVFTEEREKGTVIFRATKLGDISHLYAGSEPPSFSCRFCQVYENEDERH